MLHHTLRYVGYGWMDFNESDMKIGSLVRLKYMKILIEPPPGVVFPRHGVTYTIRDIQPPIQIRKPCIVLDEIVNPIGPGGIEYSFAITCFIELLPPMQSEIEELLKETVPCPTA